MYHLKKVILNDGSDQLNLIDHNKKIEEERIQSFTTHFILDHIKNKNKESFFLGEVIRCACRRELRERILCFKMEKEQELVKDMYITIMTKGFQIYNHHMKLSNFKSYGDLELPYKPNEDEKSREISIELVDINGNPLEEELMKNITSPGNLVFIHPDSFR